MDFQALKTDVEKALAHLPKTIVDVLVKTAETVVVKERDALESALPKILELLKPHIGAAMMEASVGMLDTKELETTLMEVLKPADINGANRG